MLVASLTAFALLVGVTSFSQNGIVLDVLSSMTGIACAASIPTSLGILSLMYPVPSRRRNLAFSSFLMGTPAATIIGGLSSGALAMKISWKAPFIILAGLYAIVSFLAWFLVPDVSMDANVDEQLDIGLLSESGSSPIIPVKKYPESDLLSFDWLGSFLLLAGVLLFTVALTIGPQGLEPWKTPTVILLLTLGLLLLGCFILWESVTEYPIVPPSV
jgi:MFS family permease